MTHPRVSPEGSVLPIEGTEPHRAPGTLFIAEPRRPADEELCGLVTGSVVVRRALFDRLAAARRVTQITAPAGSGKTMLLRSWVHQAGLVERTGWAGGGSGGGGAPRVWVSVVAAPRSTPPRSARGGGP